MALKQILVAIWWNEWIWLVSSTDIEILFLKLIQTFVSKLTVFIPLFPLIFISLSLSVLLSLSYPFLSVSTTLWGIQTLFVLSYFVLCLNHRDRSKPRERMSLCVVLEATWQIENKKSAVLKPKQNAKDIWLSLKNHFLIH